MKNHYIDSQITNPSPTPRSCKTFQQTYKFGDQPPSPIIQQPNPTYHKSKIFNQEIPNTITINRQRISSHHRSDIFLQSSSIDNQKQQPIPHNNNQSIRTFKMQQTAIVPQQPHPPKSPRFNPHRATDQPTNSFYPTDNKNAVVHRQIQKKQSVQVLTESRVRNQQESNIFFRRNSIQQDVGVRVRTESVQEDHNCEVKRTNQQFSDIFDLEYGYKGPQRRIKQCVSSSVTKWTDHDSIRNRRESFIQSDGTKDDLSRLSQNPLNTARSDRLSEKEINVILDQQQKLNRTMKAINGELLPEYKEERIILQKNSNNDRNIYKNSSKQSFVYTGIYSWKNNYKGRK